ncbi:hypothetical protein [Lolliginicoccus suaedae]|nr:hypothetical protein [Lolliginicoccus suaedae]
MAPLIELEPEERAEVAAVLLGCAETVGALRDGSRAAYALRVMARAIAE